LDIKWRSYSHAWFTKLAVFMLAVICFTGVMVTFIKVEVNTDGGFAIVWEENYFQSRAFVRESGPLISNLARLLGEFKSEAHILSGGTISEEEWRYEEERLFEEFMQHSRSYRPDWGHEENYRVFQQEYADQITQAKEDLIKQDLKEFHALLQNLKEIKGPFYYVSDGKQVYANTTIPLNQQARSHPAYLIVEHYKQEMYPAEIKENPYLRGITEPIDELDPENLVIYLAFPQEMLNREMHEWQEDKAFAAQNLYQLAGFGVGLLLTFLYLVAVTGKQSFGETETHVHRIDRIFTDVKIVLCFVLIVVLMEEFDYQHFPAVSISLTLPFAAAGLALVLSLVRHLKSGTLFKHSFMYWLISGLVRFIGNVYASGPVGIKTVLLVVGYPVLVAATFFMFPVTLGIAAWFAYKKVKSFQAIQQGVERIKNGDIHHRIDPGGNGEFARLASNINSITNGLKKAVDSELKSERLKTELITNVSHDIRTPLTSIITYVDLLKQERDPAKMEEYIGVLEQKARRLKVLTDDLFEAAKASTGNIPVQLERIDLVSLITQGLGELSANMEEAGLDIRITHPQEKVYVRADGKLLWRSIENVLSNIIKYALKGSRVYIDIADTGNDVLLTFKNISAYELNISADELMERFTRGDESRSSSGSGLGLSIAKSLVEAQKGKFTIQVDGDLFKSMLSLPKHLQPSSESA